ncbi:MAG: peptidylprolyl isomerase [Bacteroidetes bacterium CHB5]|nr:peptidylprolyl isomerase [Bacteroidetes bacterium CHB5]
MQQLIRFLKNLSLFFLLLTSFIFLFEDRVVIPVWLQVAGRLHPALLHIPIGIVVMMVLLLLVRSQFKSKQFKKVLAISLTMATVTITLTAFFGLLLSFNDDYGADSLQQHKVSGLALAWLSYFVLIFYLSTSEIRMLKHTGILLVFTLLVFVGHTGSVLTHGENFILAPLQTSVPVVDSVNASVYQLAVMPVLEKKCFSCHNEKKAKGKLIMTDPSKFKTGGESGLAFVAGKPDSSRMIHHILLPLEHDEHMPPDGKPQLTGFEIDLLKAWINSGADFDKPLAAYNPTDTIIKLAGKTIKSHYASSVNYTFKPATPELIQKLNTPFRSVLPIHINSPALQADFFVKEYFTIQSLKELQQINEQLVVLSLSKMPITDSDLQLLSGFQNLEKLNLNFTNLSGTGLVNLDRCSNLKSISLAGTQVTPETIKPLLNLPNLKTLFIWNTGIDTTQQHQLEKDYPTINFVHTPYKDESILTLSKPLLVNEGILTQQDLLTLKHTMPGVTIRYSLDGSKPDSVNGVVYYGPIKLDETVKLQAVACKPGWYCSNPLETTVYLEGYKPENITLLTPADKQYRGEGAASLTDGRKGFVDIFKEPSWLGFRENDFAASFDFGAQPPTLNKVVISYGDNLGSYIFPPTEVQIWGGQNEHNLKLLTREKITGPTGYRTPFNGFIPVSLKESNFQYYKIVAKPISKLPKWHEGKGQKGWFFVDEVFFY